MIKLKDILSESKVELGKVYSNPYATAFKPQETIKEEEQLKEDDHEVGMGLSSLKIICSFR